MNRLADLALAVPALAAAAPAIGALALAVKLDSPGPAFYVQRRVGKDRRPFGLVKLRSMVSDADRKGAHVTAAGDSRVTRVGRLLRATKLDELPQLWNVVTGEMSLVGPRPEAERYVTDAHPAWDVVLSVRPGITDLASIVFRDEESLLGGARDRERAYLEAVLPEKLALAQEGIERASLGHDLRVLAKTALAVLQGGNADHPAVARARAAVRALSELAAEPARLPPRGAKLPVVRDEPVESVRLTPAPPAKDRAPKSTAARAPAKARATPAPKRAPAKTAPKRAPANTASKRAPAKSAAKTPAAPKPRRPKKER